MLFLHTLLFYLVWSQDHTNLVGSRPECQPYDCQIPSGYTYQFGQDRDQPCFWGSYTCDTCCYQDTTASGRPCWTPDYPKANCCDVPWAHDPTCDPNANADCVLGDEPNPSDCTACGQILEQSITTAASGTGTCDPATHICENGDGACKVDEFDHRYSDDFDTCDGEVNQEAIENVVTVDQCLVACQEDEECAAIRYIHSPDFNPTNFCYIIKSCQGTTSNPIAGDTYVKITPEPSTSPTVTDIDCVLGDLPDASSCTACEEVLSQEITSPAEGIGECNPETYTCQHLDGACVEDRDCVLGDPVDPNTCTTCGEVLEQEIVEQAYGTGTCEQGTHTCADGEGTCVEDKDCVLGDPVDPSTCTECDTVLTQEVLTPEQGNGICDPESHTCAYGDGACQEPCDYVEIGNPCPNLDPGAVDYVFILDTSATLTDEDYNLFMTALAVAAELNLAADDNFAMVTFADTPVTIVPWTSGAEAGDIAEKIRTAARVPTTTSEPFINTAMQYTLEEVWEGNVDQSRDQRTYVITYNTASDAENPCERIDDYHNDGIDVYAILSGSERYDCWESNGVFMKWYENPETMISQHAFVDPSCGTFTPFDGFYAATGANEYGPVFANSHEQTLAMSYGDPGVQVWQFTDPDTSVMISVYLTPGASLRPPDEQRWEYEGPDVLTVAYSDVEVVCKETPYPSPAPVTTKPSRAPSPDPTTISPTTSPTRTPSTTPSKTPSAQPTTDMPTGTPSNLPTTQPSSSPSRPPTTEEPTKTPSKTPSSMPTTEKPTRIPSVNPTKSPSGTPSTSAPSVNPTVMPSDMPSMSPTLGCKPFVLGTSYTVPREILEARTDYGLILDSSSSITDEEYNTIMAAFADLVTKYFTYETERAGLMIYSSYNQHEFPIAQRSPEELAEKFLNANRIYGATLTSTALYFAYQEMWSEPGIIDSDIRQRAVLITDGKPSAGQDPCSQIHLYTNSGLELYVIAIGDDAYDSLRCFWEDFSINVLLVPDIETLVSDLPKYLQIERIDKINFDTYYHCTEGEINGAPLYRSDEGWEAFVDYDGHWTVRDPSGSINCDLKDTEPAGESQYPEAGRTWTCLNGVFEDVSVQYWSYSPTNSPTLSPSIPAPTEGPTVTPPCDSYYVEQINALQARVDELESRVNTLESEVSQQENDLATCEGKFDEIYNGIDNLLSCDACVES